MKYKLLLLNLLIFCLSGLILGQETKVKRQFGILSENGNFFSDLKTPDIQMPGYKDLSLELFTNNTLELMIMIDTSVSQEKILPFEKKVAEILINDYLKAGKDKVAIISFSGKILLEQDLTDNFQNAKEQIEKIKIVFPPGYIGGGVRVATPPIKDKNQVPQGSTSMWDSIKQVADAFSKIPVTNSRRAIILISDGVNTFGKSNISEAVEFSIKTNIPVFAIGIGDDSYGGVYKKALKKITEETGGIVIFPKKKVEDLTEELKLIEQGLRSHYEITFTVNSSISKGKMQEFKFEITNPEIRKQKLQVIQPKGFFLSN